MVLDNKTRRTLSERETEVESGSEPEYYKEEKRKNLIKKKEEKERQRKDRESVLYLYTTHIHIKEKYYEFNQDGRKIYLSHEPNDLFVRYRITNLGDLQKITYYVDNEIKKFEDFKKDLNNRKLGEINVYFVKYNEKPLYMSISFEYDEKIENTSEFHSLTYSLNKNGEWEKASHYAYIFSDLNEQAYRNGMFQCFEIESKENNVDKSKEAGDSPYLTITHHEYAKYKFYKHKYINAKPITKFFLYRKKVVKNIALGTGEVDEVDVYYHKDDKDNMLPLVIEIHRKNEINQFYENEGGNYSWKLHTGFSLNAQKNDYLNKLLNKKEQELIGTKFDLDIGDYFDDLYDFEREFNGLDVFIQEHKELGYRSIRYKHKDKRFSISKLTHMEDELDFPDLPVYSVEAFYVFHHGSGTYPLLLCAVYESKQDNIYVWYQLKNSREASGAAGSQPAEKTSEPETKLENGYEISYFFSDHPVHFEKAKPMIHLMESKHYVIDVNLGANLASSQNYRGKKLTLVGGHNFDILHQPIHPRHHKYVVTPAFSNYFTVRSLSLYGEKVICEELDSAKEVHVFEHVNLHHYKLCVATSKYNYLDETDEVTYRWFEVRKSTNRSLNWSLVGRPAITKTPDEFDNANDIDVLMNEKVAYDSKEIDVYYVISRYPIRQGNIPIVYGIYKKVIYDPKKPWPPIPPEKVMHYVPGKNYTTVTYGADGSIRGTTTNLPGKMGGMTPLVGGLIGSGAGVGLFTVTTGYVLYSNMGNITQTLIGLIH